MGPGVDYAVHVLRGIVKARIGRIDVRMASLAGRARGEAGMSRIGRREAVARAAACSCQIVRIGPYRRLVCAARERRAVAVCIGAPERCLIINRIRPTRLCERAELDGPCLDARRIVFRTQEMIESDRPDAVMALAAHIRRVKGGVFRMGGRLVGIDRAIGRRHMTGGAVLQRCRQSAPMTECACRGARHPPDPVELRSVAAVAGIEARRAGLAVEIPRGADGIERRNRAEGCRDLQDPGMCRQRGMADLAPRIAAG